MVKRTQERKEASNSSTLPIGMTNTRTTELPPLPRTGRKILGRDGTKAVSKPLPPPPPQESEGPVSDTEADRHDMPRDTFLQIEPSHVTTKAFVAYGLLSASLQNHQEKSVEQQGVTRETSPSLVSVPTKPPPLQTGHLDPITAHEGEGKREGGLGAVLTERERESWMAERRCQFDEPQKQQLEMVQNGPMRSLASVDTSMTSVSERGMSPAPPSSRTAR